MNPDERTAELKKRQEFLQ